VDPEDTVAIIQARMTSTRLPGKVLRDLGGRPVLDWVVRAATEVMDPDRIVVATSTAIEDESIADRAKALGVRVTRGAVEDVLGRYSKASEEHGGKVVVRLTADCPLLDPSLIRAAVAAFAHLDVDYLSTTNPRSLPRGLDVEVVRATAIQRADHNAVGADRAHVTSWLYREPGRALTAGLSFSPPADDLRVTLDTEDDAVALDAIVSELGDRPPPWREIVDLLRKRDDITALNNDVRQKGLDEG
jgi:spore coat polysaccharide biosynthesis protein SpsF